MLIDAVAIALVAATAYFTNKYLKHRIERKRALNRLLAVASEDFHKSARSLLKTPDELPQEVLNALSMMSRTGFEEGSEKMFLEALRTARKEKGRTTDSISRRPGLNADIINGMRQELQDLFVKAVMAWFNIMTHKSARYHDKIAMEELKAEAERFVGPSREIATASYMRPIPC